MSYTKKTNPAQGFTNNGAAESATNYEKTRARLQRIQSHLDNSPRGTQVKGKVCIITGVGSLKGIGRATALLYAHEGASALYLLDYAGENLPNLKETITKKYPDVKVVTVQGDAADETVIKGLCDQAIAETGRLDVFFANAGVATGTFLPDVTVDEFSSTLRINVIGPFLAIKHASAAMFKVGAGGKEEAGGSIILTASIAGMRSGGGSVDYSASKAAVISLAKTSSYQLARTNVRVNSISPGLIETGMTTATFSYAESKGTAGKIGQLNPLGRFAVAEEVANAALFLGSDASSYVNGQNIAVDGGLSASHPVVPGRWF